MEIRPTTIADIPVIQQIAKISWDNTYVTINSKEQIDYMLSKMYSTEEITRHMADPNYHYFLIADDAPVGFVGFENHYDPGTTKLHRIYFLPDAQGKGFGRKAIDLVKEKAVQAGNHRVMLTVNKKNPAQKAYEALGFQVYGEEVNDIGEGYVMDDFLMECNL